MITADTLNRRLKQEVTRRRAAEGALRECERHSRKSLTQAHQLQDQMRHLSHQILTVQEEERKRMSRELHYEVVQTLTGISVQLTNLKTAASANEKGLQQKITSTQHLVEKSVEIVHRFARRLRPTLLDDLGLIAALQSLVKEFTERSGIPIQFSAFASARIEQLDSAQCTALYRVAQEALANVSRHAKATLVKITVQKQPGVILMEVSDNGRGFEVAGIPLSKQDHRLGLLGMSERIQMVGGQFNVESAPGRGTTLRAQIPVRKPRGSRRKQ